jgi:phenylacetate-CoA ligase
MFVGGLPAVSAVWSLGAAVIPIGSTAGTQTTLDYIERLRATVVTCTPSYAAHLLVAGGERLAKLHVELLILGGEPGAQIQSIRTRLSNGWQAGVRDVMGLGEIASGCWAECGYESGMHFTGQEDVLVEIIDPKSRAALPWEQGVTGELVYTAVEREATPVLRFRSHDHVEVVGTECPCGRTSPRIRVKGRVDDMFIVRGVNVFPTAVREVVSAQGPEFSGQLRIRLSEREGQVTSPVAIDVEAGVDVSPDEFPRMKAQLEDAIRRQLVFRASVQIVGPGVIPPTTHKTQYVVREVATDRGA